MGEKRVLKVFIASPGDLALERKACREAIDRLNGDFGEGAGVAFEILRWEDEPPVFGRRPQDRINEKVDECDVFLLVMFARWGQAAADSDYASYTEEEFRRAETRWRATKGDDAPSPTILIFFRDVPLSQLADPGSQLEKVLAFKKQLEDENQVLYKTFENDEEFGSMVTTYLKQIARGDLVAPRPPQPVDLDSSAIESTTAKDGAERVLLELAREAIGDARAGKVEQARVLFARLVTKTSSSPVMRLAGDFFKQIGELDEAESLYLRAAESSTTDQHRIEAINGIGIVHRIRGDLVGAERSFEVALDLCDNNNNLQSKAAVLGNLGVVYQLRNDLDAAEKIYNNSLAIFDRLGDSKGIAVSHGILGLLYLARGNFDAAEQSFTIAYSLHTQQNNPQGQATDLGNLAIVHHNRGDLNKAAATYLDAIEISKHGGLIGECLARPLANLGRLRAEQDKPSEAKSLYLRAREVFKRLGNASEVATVDQWIAELDTP